MLRHLRNLGPASERMLNAAGVHNEAQLRDLGAVAAYRLVLKAGLKPSLNLLYALEGALLDEDWQVVARTRKLSLLLQLEEHNE